MCIEPHVSPIDVQIITKFSSGILDWAETNNRNSLFWRKTSDPYCILISEILLQKTTAKQVSDVIGPFIKKYPSPYDLSNGTIEEIRQLITSLGLEYKRAETCNNIAKMLCNKYGGNVPKAEKELLSLPGVGPYISHAVLCFAFGEQVPIVDTNVRRVLGRVFGIDYRSNIQKQEKKIWVLAAKLVNVSNGQARKLNFAFLDFGASVCTSRNPSCPTCCTKELCIEFKVGTKDI